MLLLSLMIKICLTELKIFSSGTNVGLNEPFFILELNYEQQLKNTPGITGLYNLIVLIDNYVWHLDVDLSYPHIAEDIKGLAVR